MKPFSNFLFLCIFSSIFISTSNGFIFGIFERIEENAIQKLLTNCTEGKVVTLQDYERLKYLAIPKLQSVLIKHYTENKEDVYLFPKSHEGILASPRYNRSLPMVILIHGYFGSFFPFNYMDVVNSIKSSKTANVFVLDHTILMSDTYYAASTNARVVGEALGEMLSKLYAGGIRNFHLVGHSLGAHISGFAGKVFQAKTWTKLNRISGLDPAGPCFLNEKTDKRLTTTDADFVDVIHTARNTYGINLSIGHVDFYPNRGDDMPGCFTAVCSHLKVPFYFAESVLNNQYLAVSCPDWETFKRGGCVNNPTTYMGYWTSTTTRGNYFLTTNPFYSYAKGNAGITQP